MDKDLNEILKSLANYGNIDGISEIKEEMEQLNGKLAEYKGMTRLNSYNVPTIICQIDKYNVSLENKYSKYYEKFNNPSKYNVNVFGASNDSFEQKIESSLNVLGKIAVSKICDYYGTNLTESQLSSSNSELLKTFNTITKAEDTGDDILDTKMSFKVIY